jgi:hypothetical protein
VLAAFGTIYGPTLPSAAVTLTFVYWTCSASCCCFAFDSAGTARPAHPISPPAVADFVNSATHGVVLAAFGTIYGPTLRPEDIHELAKGFAALAPVRVVWALKPAALRLGIRIEDLPLGDNTLVVPWVDYNVGMGAPQGGGEWL